MVKAVLFFIAFIFQLAHCAAQTSALRMGPFIKGNPQVLHQEGSSFFVATRGENGTTDFNIYKYSIDSLAQQQSTEVAREPWIVYPKSANMQGSDLTSEPIGVLSLNTTITCFIRTYNRKNKLHTLSVRTYDANLDTTGSRVIASFESELANPGASAYIFNEHPVVTLMGHGEENHILIFNKELKLLHSFDNIPVNGEAHHIDRNGILTLVVPEGNHTPGQPAPQKYRLKSYGNLDKDVMLNLDLPGKNQPKTVWIRVDDTSVVFCGTYAKHAGQSFKVSGLFFRKFDRHTGASRGVELTPWSESLMLQAGAGNGILEHYRGHSILPSTDKLVLLFEQSLPIQNANLDHILMVQMSMQGKVLSQQLVTKSQAASSHASFASFMHKGKPHIIFNDHADNHSKDIVTKAYANQKTFISSRHTGVSVLQAFDTSGSVMQVFSNEVAGKGMHLIPDLTWPLGEGRYFVVYGDATRRRFALLEFK